MSVNVTTEELFALIGRMKVEIDKKNDLLAAYEAALAEARESCDCGCNDTEAAEES